MEINRSIQSSLRSETSIFRDLRIGPCSRHRLTVDQICDSKNPIHAIANSDTRSAVYDFEKQERRY